MKRLFSIAVVLLLVAGCQPKEIKETKEEPKEMKETVSADKPLLRHVVLFSYREKSQRLKILSGERTIVPKGLTRV